MKTATLNDLETRPGTILAWLRSGEDVVVKGAPAAKTEPAQKTVDWSKSAVFGRPPTGKLDMTEAELQEFYRDMRGSF